jgi:hypothetical protein
LIMQIHEIISEIRTNIGSITPHKVSDYAVELSVYMFDISEKLAQAEIAYCVEWAKIRKEVKTNGEAEKLAKATEYYKSKKILETQYKSIKEIINALKSRLRLLSEEAQSRY